MIENEQIELHDKDGQPILKKQLTALTAGGEEDYILDEGDSINITTESPNAQKMENAEL
jgi:hypothetical protein